MASAKVASAPAASAATPQPPKPAAPPAAVVSLSPAAALPVAASPAPDMSLSTPTLDSSIPADSLQHATIMIVDDEELNIRAAEAHLRREGYYRFLSAKSGREAIDRLRHERPDIMLLDIRMPEVSGLEVLRWKNLEPELAPIPVVIFTAATDPATKREALDLGAADFLPKPIDPNDLVPRIRNLLVLKRQRDQMASEAARLEELVRVRTAEVLQSRQQLILSLARAAEHRDNETGNHIIRVGRYAAIIARQLGWSESQVSMIEQAAPLHDVGKLGVPDRVLFKPGSLDPQEYDLIKKHCAWGKEIIEPLSGREFQILRSHARLGEAILHVRSSPMLMMASRIAQTHHECWDGTGYPLGLAGEDIPIEGRITAVADVFDALSSKRPYKDPFPREKCFRILEEYRGRKFDPRVLDAFFARSAEIIETQLELMDYDPIDPATRMG